MGDKISEMGEMVKKKLSEIKNLQELQELKVKYLGKKGEVTSMLKGLRFNVCGRKTNIWAKGK